MTRTAYILTHHWVPNFGANLQAYVTARALESRDVTPIFVDFRPSELVTMYSASVPPEQIAAHEAFVAEHMTLTGSIRTHQDFEALCADQPADVYITGSDAVFRLAARSIRTDLIFPNPYWLVGALGPSGSPVTKVALAPSAMGSRFDRLPATTQAGIRDALREMTSLSVRDTWTQRQLRSVGHAGPIAIVPDPVFSLIAEIRAARVTMGSRRRYIVLCTQGRASSKWTAAFTALADSYGYDTVALPSPEGLVDDGTTRSVPLPLSPFEWMRIIAQSDGYVGGRFHPLVVALTAGAPVVSFDLYHANPLNPRSSKSWLLMRDFGIATHCYARHLHRFVTPTRVFRTIQEQRKDLDRRRDVPEKFHETLERFFDDALGTKRRRVLETS